jgi:hypothetical protein
MWNSYKNLESHLHPSHNQHPDFSHCKSCRGFKNCNVKPWYPLFGSPSILFHFRPPLPHTSLLSNKGNSWASSIVVLVSRHYYWMNESEKQPCYWDKFVGSGDQHLSLRTPLLRKVKKSNKRCMLGQSRKYVSTHNNNTESKKTKQVIKSRNLSYSLINSWRDKFQIREP